MHHSSKRLAIFSLILVAFSSLACAGMQRAADRQRIIENRTRNYVYNMPCTQIIPETRQLLFNRGYSVKNTGEGAKSIETEWRFNNARNERSRYLIQAIDRDGNSRCAIRANRSFEDLRTNTTNPNIRSGRDLDFEWYILQEVAPADAANIRQEADAATATS